MSNRLYLPLPTTINSHLVSLRKGYLAVVSTMSSSLHLNERQGEARRLFGLHQIGVTVTFDEARTIAGEQVVGTPPTRKSKGRPVEMNE